MNERQRLEGEKNVLRWGGLAGILGGILFLGVFVFVGAIVGPDPATAEGPVTRFPEIRAARTLENSLYLVVLALFVIHFVALYRAVRWGSPAPALFGTVTAIVGLTVLAAGALPHFVTSRLSNLYRAPGASSEDQATVVMLWQANQGLFDALLAVGVVLVPIGLVALGLAMLRAPAFGRRFGGATVALGVVGIGGASAFVVDPLHPFAPAVSLLTLTVFHLVLGSKVYRQSNAASLLSADLAGLRATESSPA